MLKAVFVVIALAASPSVSRDVWEADIELPPDTSPVYVLPIDDPKLAEAMRGLSDERIDVLDAQGKAMPRGSWSPGGNTGPHRDVALTPTNPRQLRVEPLACAQPRRVAECVMFDHEPDFAASQLPMEQRLHPARGSGARTFVVGGRVGATSRTATGPGVIALPAGGSASGGARGPTASAEQAPPMPLRYDVVDIALPADSARLVRPSLVVRWKSSLVPTAIAWQIGSHVAQVTTDDRALLGEDAQPLEGWNQSLLRAWLRKERFAKFGPLDARHDDDGSWEIEIPLEHGLETGSLEIGTAPLGAATLLNVRLVGDEPRYSPPVVQKPGERMVWFDNLGTPPYRLRAGAKSGRRPERMSYDEARLTGIDGRTVPDAPIQLALATITGAHRSDATESVPSETSPTSTVVDKRLVPGIVLLAIVLVAALAAVDNSIRAKIARRREGAQ